MTYSPKPAYRGCLISINAGTGKKLLGNLPIVFGAQVAFTKFDFEQR